MLCIYSKSQQMYLVHDAEMAAFLRIQAIVCISTYASPLMTALHAAYLLLRHLAYQILESKQCGCLGFDLTQGDDYVKVRNEMVFVTSYIEDFSADTQRRVVATLCNGVMNDGDHLQVCTDFVGDLPTKETRQSLLTNGQGVLLLCEESNTRQL